jgi:sortase A
MSKGRPTSDDTVVAQPPSSGPPPGAPRMTAGDKVRLVMRGIGQILITAGLVVLLFVAYEVWITNIAADRAQAKIHSKLEKEWARGDDPLLPLPGTKDRTIPLGTGIANLYLPRLGIDYHWTIVEGTDQNDLSKGPGHYTGTALPGQVGNFSVAGHRVGKGEPFLNLDKLRSGDAVVVETKTTWFVYRIKGAPAGGDPQTDRVDADGVPGREIVEPSAGRVLLPVPNQRDTAPTEKLMTMTTCHPKFTAAQRMILHAALDTKVARTGDAMPASVKALYREVRG